jgi:hypothetical protein
VVSHAYIVHITLPLKGVQTVHGWMHAALLSLYITQCISEIDGDAHRQQAE